MLTVHHLRRSQSERIVWLCEELAIPYELKSYDRAPTGMAPAEYQALHPLGAAPVITDDDLVLAESGAIIEYIIAKHGAGRLAAGPDDPDFAPYLYWFHFVNGTLQPGLVRNMLLGRGGVPDDDPLVLAMSERLDRAIALVESRLSQVPYLAGDRFTAADIMIVFGFTTMRHFLPLDLAPYPGIVAYLGRIAGRPAYRAAMEKSDPGMPLLLT